MSRLYRHNPVLTDKQGHNTRARSFKRISSKKTRRTPDLPNGNGYRKNGLTYSICDFITSLWWARGIWRKPWKWWRK